MENPLQSCEDLIFLENSILLRLYRKVKGSALEDAVVDLTRFWGSNRYAVRTPERSYQIRFWKRAIEEKKTIIIDDENQLEKILGNTEVLDEKGVIVDKLGIYMTSPYYYKNRIVGVVVSFSKRTLNKEKTKELKNHIEKLGKIWEA